MVEFFPGGKEEASNYTKSCARKFTPICPKCGRISDKTTTPNRLYKTHTIACVCKDGVSIPNKVIRNLMEQALELGMITSYEKEFKDIDERGIIRRFDMKFVDINNNPYFIEMDGGGHGDIQQKHGRIKFIPSRLFVPDFMKDRLAKKLNIPLIRIDCFKSEIEYIKNNIYGSELSNILDLNKIDWVELERNCFKSIMVDICKYKNDHPDSFAPEVAKLFNTTPQSVRTYWKRGVVLGLCEYDPTNESRRKNSIQTKPPQSVGLYILNLDTNEDWIFQSKKDFFKQSKNILDGDVMTTSKLSKRFNKTKDNFIIYDSGLSEYLIWEIRR